MESGVISLVLDDMARNDELLEGDQKGSDQRKRKPGPVVKGNGTAAGFTNC
jgi:hypothetical protein